MRINKFLAQAGIASRRKVDELIEEGRVFVDKQRAKLGQEVDPSKEEITVDNKPVSKSESLEYIILNKPKGITSTSREFHGQKNVLQLVKSKNRLFPVGRLDIDSEGLILLTNDGELANVLTHPKHHVPKVYSVMFLGKVGNDKINSFEKGVRLEEGMTKPAKVKIVSRDDHKSILEITLFEGKKRQIRRMSASLHLHILSLRRISVGPVSLGDLPVGKFRTLSSGEISGLKKSANLLN